MILYDGVVSADNVWYVDILLQTPKDTFELVKVLDKMDIKQRQLSSMDITSSIINVTVGKTQTHRL